ncbi:MAG: extracellular solute-binding protein [Spirochaetales bacterium]|nr:MAG: extracellular solute-binding protein [Spirochaetales bacterium]
MKKLVTMLLAAAVLLAVISCKKKEETAETAEVKKAEVITLRIMSPESDFTDAWIQEWNTANPEIQLVREENDYPKWIADFLAGSPADILNVGYGAEIPYFVKRGMFLDLSDYFAKSTLFKESDIDIGGSGAYKVEGKWYGLPKDYNNVGAITYNKDIFKKAGIPFPSATEPMSYQEFFNLAKKLTSKQGGNVIFGTEVHGAWTNFLASDMAYMLGKNLHSADGLTMNEDKDVREIWKYFLRLRKQGISSNIENPLSGWAGSAFQADGVAMVQLGYWYGASCAGVEGYLDKYGWAPEPVMVKGGTRVTNNLGATGFCISAKTKYPDEVFKVFEWYMAGSPGIERAKTGWGIPPLKSLQPMLPEANAFDKARKDLALEEVKYMKAPQMSLHVRGAVYESNWKESERAYLAGEVNEDGAVDKFYKAMNEAITLGKEEVGE